jgi:hypothetical protein
MPEPAPLPDENGRALSRDELAIVRRAYARQMLAILGVDNPAIEPAYAGVRREAFLGPPPWTASSRYGAHRLAGADPVVLYQDLVIALDPARGGPCLETKRHESSAAIWPAAAPVIPCAARAEGAQPGRTQEAFRAPRWRVSAAAGRTRWSAVCGSRPRAGLVPARRTRLLRCK